jgi:murein L,D-transpeptidase YcbB/YkuD
LGILKFHFDNKYSVYLHDTNQRYLFTNAMRSLSHGCVRVQDWQDLAFYIIRNDSLRSGGSVKIDSVKTWLKRKEKHHIALKNKLPVYIRYISCEAREGSLRFFDDVYGDDRQFREKFFASR